MSSAKKIIGIDVGASGLKVGFFSINASGKIELKDFVSSPFEKAAVEEMTQEALVALTLKQILTAHKWGALPAYISLAGHAIFSRPISLPPVKLENLEQTIGHEAIQNIPFPIDEVSWDYHLADASPSGEQTALLVAVKNEMVEGLAHAVDVVGLQAVQFDAAPVAMVNGFRYNYPDYNESALILDIGASATNLIFVDGGKNFFRNVPVGGYAITHQISEELSIPEKQAEELKLQYAELCIGGIEASGYREKDIVMLHTRNSVVRLIQEVVRSITFYKNTQGGRSPSMVLLAGGSARIRGLQGLVAKKLQVKVALLDTLQKVVIPPSIDSELITEQACQLGELIGLAVSAKGSAAVNINLITEHINQARYQQKRKPLILLSAVLALLILLVAGFGLAKVNHLAAKEAKLVEKQVGHLKSIERRLQPIESKIDRLKRKVQVYEALITDRSYLLDVCLKLKDVVPDGIFIQAVDPIYAKRNEQRNYGAKDKLLGLRLSFVSYLDKEKKGTDIVIVLRDRIRGIDLFSDKTEIYKRPTKKLFAREFIIDALFSEPASL